MAKSDRKSKKSSLNALERIEGSRELRSPQRPRFIVLSFRHLDPAQGQSLKDMEEHGLLAKAMERLRSLCNYSLPEATVNGIVSLYKEFPEGSGFTYPLYVPGNVKWASVRVESIPRVIGYFEENIFYIVFFDEFHAFWPSKKKHT